MKTEYLKSERRAKNGKTLIAIFIIVGLSFLGFFISQLIRGQETDPVVTIDTVHIRSLAWSPDGRSV